MAKAYQSQSTAFNVYQSIGVSDIPGSTTTVTVQGIGSAGNVDRCFGATPPVDGEAGYAIGCYFHLTTGVAGATVYVNEGSTTSCSFRALASASGEQSTFVYNTNATAGSYTIPAVQMVNAMLDRNGGTANRADVTDTAAAIIALIPGAIVNSTFEFVLRNISATAGEKIGLTGGVGVTFSGTQSIFSGGDITYIGIVTNVGTPAITLYAEADTSALLPSIDVASSINSIQITTAAANGLPVLAAVGSDTNITQDIEGKGTGGVTIGAISTGKNSLGRGSVQPPLLSATTGSLGTTQNSTPTSLQLLGGIVTQTGSTGAGTVTLPTGTLISAAIVTALGITGATVSIGDTFECLFANLGGGQTLTITGGTGSTVVGNGAVPTAKNARMLFVNTGSNTWNVYTTVSA